MIDYYSYIHPHLPRVATDRLQCIYTRASHTQHTPTVITYGMGILLLKQACWSEAPDQLVYQWQGNRCIPGSAQLFPRSSSSAQRYSLPQPRRPTNPPANLTIRHSLPTACSSCSWGPYTPTRIFLYTVCRCTAGQSGATHVDNVIIIVVVIILIRSTTIPSPFIIIIVKVKR